jgi:deazaflavin-dependent oxidoreductase (nitroreductase family)
MPNPMAEYNAKIVEEFRANEGRVGGNFEGAPLLLLHHTGAKTGTAYVNPLVYLPDGERYIIFASKAGAPTNPDWYHNLKAHPDVQIEVGTDTISVRVSEVEGEERDRLFAAQEARMPTFSEYVEKAGARKIPVIALTPA